LEKLKEFKNKNGPKKDKLKEYQIEIFDLKSGGYTLSQIAEFLLESYRVQVSISSLSRYFKKHKISINEFEKGQVVQEKTKEDKKIQIPEKKENQSLEKRFGASDALKNFASMKQKNIDQTANEMTIKSKEDLLKHKREKH